MMNTKFDIIIIGGGMVGGALACALPAKFRIALIDAMPVSAKEDPRLIALTHGSCAFLKNIGVWSLLLEHAEPIHQIHVSHRNHFGITRIHAKELHLAELGHLIPAKHINAALDKKLEKLNNVDIFRPATLQNILFENETCIVIETQHNIVKLSASFIVGADGTHSTVRELLGIPSKIVDYQQSALVTITKLQRSHKNIAYERFIDNGAIAMLPLKGNRTATIWTDDNKKISALMNLSENEFKLTLQKEFGYRLGRFQHILTRHVYPLKSIIADTQHVKNVLLIGNAAHTVHPIAAQGLNLALREVAQLCEHISENDSINDFVPWSSTFKNTISSSTQLSHRLNGLFSTDFFVINHIRQLGMIGLDMFSSAKKLFMQQAMGKSGKIPSLLLEKESHEFEHTGN